MIQDQATTQEISWSQAAPLKHDQVRITVQLLDCRYILDVNLPASASAIVTTNEIVDSISSL
jgi:hypothetical protein